MQNLLVIQYHGGFVTGSEVPNGYLNNYQSNFQSSNSNLFIQDRRQLTMGDLLEPPAPSDLTQKFTREENVEGLKISSSAKIDQLVHLLKLTPSHEKSLVFSQFTSFLDKIAEKLEEER